MKGAIIGFAVAATLLAGVSEAVAQGYRTEKIRVVEESGIGDYAIPFTSIRAVVEVESEEVFAGPYARYANQYFGASAQLNDSRDYEIRRVVLDYQDAGKSYEIQGERLKVGRTTIEHGSNLLNENGSFPVVLPNRTSASGESVEDMAHDAAQKVFALRKYRMELISGDLSDTYGAGLRAAFDEIDRLEKEYLELFFGRRVVTRSVEEFEVVPERGKVSYVLFRFSEEYGIVTDGGTLGKPVMLSVEPEDSVPSMAVKKKDLVGKDHFAVADFARCRVMFNSETLAERRLPVFQLGGVVSAQRQSRSAGR